MECSTRPSNVRVCQFRHFRMPIEHLCPVNAPIIAHPAALVKGSRPNFPDFFRPSEVEGCRPKRFSPDPAVQTGIF